MALTGCSLNSPTGGAGGGNCVPRVHIEPAIVHQGGSLTVVSTEKCNVKVPTGGWTVVAGHIEGGKALVREKSSGTFDGSFRAQLTLTGDFPLGDAYAGIKNWDYSTCADSGSCASPQGVFKVQPQVGSHRPRWSVMNRLIITAEVHYKRNPDSSGRGGRWLLVSRWANIRDTELSAGMPAGRPGFSAILTGRCVRCTDQFTAPQSVGRVAW
jgi:hypothetical protein